MTRDAFPVTAGIRFLREHGIAFTPRLYAYEHKGGTRHSAEELDVPEHAVIKTLVMETDQRQPFLVLMHGDREISTRQLARVLGVKGVAPCTEATAQRVTGYQVGGLSPFGTRTALAVYAERTIFDLPRILINGGKRGFLVEVDPGDVKKVLPVVEVDVGID